ncbi:hypothetical protein V6465_003505 [Vibrio cholerae]|nr:hypothetical protein [Vibrio cholerae]
MSRKSQDKQSFQPREPLLITRKEIIELMGRSAPYIDRLIKESPDFPEKISHGCYSRKEVNEWLKKYKLI